MTKTRSKTITTRFDPELLDWLDREAEHRHMTRRALLEAAVRCDQREQFLADTMKATKMAVPKKPEIK